MLLYRWLDQATDERGSAKALVHRDTYLSWRGLHHRVDRRAQEFAAMGIGAGHWVGLMLGNVPDFTILALALSKLDATVVPLDPTMSARDLALVLAAAPFRALITRPRGGVDALPTAAVISTKKGSLTPETPEARRRLQGTLLTCSIYKRAKDAAPSASVVLYTSDSAGDPKGVLRSAENLEAGVEQLRTTLKLSADDRVLTTAPLFQAFGFDLGMMVALRLGTTLYLEDEVAPARILKVLREQEVNVVAGMPSLYAGLAKVAAGHPLKLKNPRFLVSGSQFAHPAAEEFHARWGVRLLSIFHTPETHAVSIDRKGTAPESVGKAVDGVEIRVGQPGKLTATGHGPIWVRSAAVSGRVLGSDAAAKKAAKTAKKGKAASKTTTTTAAKKATAKKGDQLDEQATDAAGIAIGGLDAEGYCRTGDVGTLDKSGKLMLDGREDDVVKVEGKRIALGEVEGCIEAFDKVKAAQAMVISDPLGGPMVVAKVVVSGRVAAEDIIDHCARNLASYKVPRRIEFCASLKS